MVLILCGLMFQFQNGSIKRLRKIGRGSMVLMFQFQNGSIKSFTLPMCFSSLHCFNSKMVRLKVTLLASL